MQGIKYNSRNPALGQVWLFRMDFGGDRPNQMCGKRLDFITDAQDSRLQFPIFSGNRLTDFIEIGFDIIRTWPVNKDDLNAGLVKQDEVLDNL